MADTLRIQSNTFTATIRTTIHDGREYMVAPIVPLVPGVLNGVLVPPDEVARFIAAWNDAPITVGHPHDNRGAPVSAKSPQALETYCIGRLQNVEFTDGRMRAEIWIDLDKAKRHNHDSAEILRRLETGEAMEVSTGYFCEEEPGQGFYGGRPYSGIARNLRPDHVAILLHAEGACNWRDGCGAPRVNTEGSACACAHEENEDMTVLDANARATARRPSFEGTENTSWGNVDTSFEAYRNGYYRHTGAERPEDVPSSVSAAPQAMRSWIASKSLLGDPNAEDFRDLRLFPVVNPGTNRLNSSALQAVLGGRGAQADISGGARDSARSMARSLLSSQFDITTAEREFSAPFLVNLSDGTQRGRSVAIVAFLPLTDAIGTAISPQLLANGDEAMRPEALHVTLAYMGQIDDFTAEQSRWMKDQLATWSRVTAIARAEITGISRFTVMPDRHPLVLTLEGQELDLIREELITVLPTKPLERYRFRPHITLAYLAADNPTPAYVPEPRQIVFESIALMEGDTMTKFPLQGTVVETVALPAGGTETEEIVSEGLEQATITERTGGTHMKDRRELIESLATQESEAREVLESMSTDELSALREEVPDTTEAVDIPMPTLEEAEPEPEAVANEAEQEPVDEPEPEPEAVANEAEQEPVDEPEPEPEAVANEAEQEPVDEPEQEFFDEPEQELFDEVEAVANEAEQEPVDEPEPEPEATANEPEPGPSTHAVRGDEDEFLSSLKTTIEALGGLDAFKDALSAMQAEAQQERSRLLASLAANERCAFSEGDLEGMTTNQLQKLERSLQPADYSGRSQPKAGGKRKEPATNQLTEIPMPTLPLQ